MSVLLRAICLRLFLAFSIVKTLCCFAAATATKIAIVNAGDRTQDRRLLTANVEGRVQEVATGFQSHRKESEVAAENVILKEIVVGTEIGTGKGL